MLPQTVDVHVRLGADHLTAVRDALAADLNSPVGLFAEQFALRPQLEVFVLAGSDEKLVVRQPLFQAAADDRPVLHPEDGLIALPAGQILAVKERHKTVVALSGIRRKGNARG